MVVDHPFKKHFCYSLLLHLILLTILVVSFEWRVQMPVLENSDNTKIINATILDPIVLEKRPLISKTIVPESTLQQEPITPKVPPRIVPVIKKTEIKDVVVIPDKKQQELKEEIIKKQLLADLKKQKDRQKKQKQIALQQAFEKEIQELHAKSLQTQMLQERHRVAALQLQKMQGEVNKYKALILQSISRHWLIPPNVNKKVYAELLIRVAPGGTVLDVQLIKSSGNDSLDRSARSAVFKASPLPVPNESEVFDTFRQFVLRVRPENILTTETWIS